MNAWMYVTGALIVMCVFVVVCCAVVAGWADERAEDWR